MVNHVLSNESTGAGTLNVPRTGRRRLFALAVAGVATGAVLFSALFMTSESAATPTPVQADAVRWQALVAAEYPGATPGAVAETQRLTALAEAWGANEIRTRRQLAETARWQAVADSHTRSLAAESARWAGLAEHHRGLPAPLRAAADRYQGYADSLK